jgi:hypothetical protein
MNLAQSSNYACGSKGLTVPMLAKSFYFATWQETKLSLSPLEIVNTIPKDRQGQQHPQEMLEVSVWAGRGVGGPTLSSHRWGHTPQAGSTGWGPRSHVNKYLPSENTEGLMSSKTPSALTRSFVHSFIHSLSCALTVCQWSPQESWGVAASRAVSRYVHMFNSFQIFWAFSTWRDL